MNTKHWKLIQGFALAALLPLCAACSSEDDCLPQDADKQPVQVNITRATTDDISTWENNDVVKLFITQATGASTTTTSTYDGASGWSNIEMILPATVTAVYPSTATSASSFNLPTDQSDEAKFRSADYMTSENQTVHNTPLSLTLNHRGCKVTVTISNYEGYPTPPTVSNETFYSLSTIAYNNDSWTGTGTATSITPLKTASDTDGKHVYQAIVAPCASYLPFMTLTVDGKERTVNCNQALESGKAYTFDLSVTNNELILTPTDELPGWGTGDEEQII